MKVVITQTSDAEKEDISKIVEAIMKTPLRVMPEIEIKPIQTQQSGKKFNLTEAMLDVLKRYPGQWFNALQIEQEILQIFPGARGVGYKPGGIRKGIAASGLYLEKKGLIEVDKSQGSGSYRYRVART